MASKRESEHQATVWLFLINELIRCLWGNHAEDNFFRNLWIDYTLIILYDELKRVNYDICNNINNKFELIRGLQKRMIKRSDLEPNFSAEFNSIGVSVHLYINLAFSSGAKDTRSEIVEILVKPLVRSKENLNYFK